MTLRFDLALAHLARRLAPDALLVAGGMEATFRPELMFELGPFDRVVLGEGERPLLELAARLRTQQPLGGIQGMAERRADGGVLRLPQPALDREAAARRDLLDAVRKHAVRGVLGSPRSGVSSGRLADQGGARSFSRRDTFGAPDHTELLPDGLFVLLLDELPARSARQRGRNRTPGSRRVPANDPAHRRCSSACAHRHLPGRHLRVHEGQAHSAAVRRHRRSEGARRHPAGAAIHQHQSHRCDDAGALVRDATRGLSRVGLRHRELLTQCAAGVQQGADSPPHRAGAFRGA